MHVRLCSLREQQREELIRREIADEFKIVVVDAIRAMCLKFPQKHRLLMSFLSNVLREEGGFHYKKAIVDTLLIIIGKVPEAKEAGLAHLCEFIEDCEFTPLSTQILHLLGVEGPSTLEPSKCIRFIYNRVVLENATVRASAVSAPGAPSGGQSCSAMSSVRSMLWSTHRSSAFVYSPATAKR